MSKINAKMAIAIAPQKMFFSLQQHFEVWCMRQSRKVISSSE
jgi:hypothetical protein